jgi:hypothetical protein
VMSLLHDDPFFGANPDRARGRKTRDQKKSG